MASAARLSSFVSLGIVLVVAGCGGGSGETDASTPGTDTSVDANADVGGACHADVDCNDGLFCNGDERCSAGACVAGTGPACSDEVACTRDFCSEDRRACVHQVPDADMDGHGDATCVDATGNPLGDDCADDDANRFPGNTETCDAMMHDEDCVMTTHGRVDSDSDGFEDVACCNGADCGTDCDDSNRSVSPMAIEVCDHLDDDCDGHVDEAVGVMVYPDADRDGYGNSAMMQVTQCGDTVGFSAIGGDCDDARVDRNPGQLEVCDMVDNDCDTSVDEDAGNVPWYVDADHDGYGDRRATALVQCMPPTGSYSLVGTDCDDTTSSRSPRVAEVCNAIDDDCNGIADFAIAPGDLEDDDRDGVADLGCGAPRGMDCNDRDPTALPGAPEICNGRDDDCDMHVDEDATSATFHRDADHDGYGDPGTAVIACFAPTDYVADASDCDDTAPMRHPGATETCNASDDDCDRRIDETPAASSCTIPGAIAACTVGICHQVGCQPGSSDCTIADGCETSSIANDAHCGDCTTVCDPMSQQCAQSSCEPGGLGAIAGVSTRDDVGTAIALTTFGTVIGGTYSGTGFGVGCGTHLDARGIAGIVSTRGSMGECTHVLAIDGSGDDVVTALTTDAADNVYVALTTTSPALSIGSIAVDAVAGQGGRDVVIAALDRTLVPMWARRYGGPFDDSVTDIVCDGSPDLWFVGAMRGPVAFTGSNQIPTTGSTDAVAVHLGPAGMFRGFANANTTGDDGALGVTLDVGSLYIVGSLAGPGMFGTRSVTSMGTDGFLWVVDRADAHTVSARAIGGAGTDVTTGVALSTDPMGAHLAIAGTFQGTLTVDTISVTSAGMSDGFVVGFDASASSAQWIVPFGGTTEDRLNDLIYAGHAFIAAGTFTGMASVGVTDAGVSASGLSDAVLVTVGTTGFPQPPSAFGGTGRDDALALAGLPANGLAYVAGDSTGDWVWVESSFLGKGGLDAFWLSFLVSGT